MIATYVLGVEAKVLEARACLDAISFKEFLAHVAELIENWDESLEVDNGFSFLEFQDEE